MSAKEFEPPSLIYSGYDYPADGIGNHLSLLDRLVFDSVPNAKKSLHALQSPSSDHPPYGLVATFDHLDRPGAFENCLYLDISRDMCEPEQIERSRQRAIAHKHAFNAVTALYLMWESDSLSPALETLPGAFDFVIVTSNLLDDYLTERGIDFCHLLHPYDYAEGNEQDGDSSNGTVVFGVSCGLWPRKNVSLLARIFAKTFANDPAYVLKIHTRFDPTQADFTAEQEQLTELLASYNNIQLEVGSLTRSDYIDWMGSLDAYCFISSGEGYSITPREALHLGVPAIVLDAHVHREFSHLPGVVRVSDLGKKAAIPNHDQAHLEQGHDWKVDERSLEDALHYAAKHHVKLRQDLRDNYSQVSDFHDISRIKQNWIAELNKQYSNHVGHIGEYIPSILERDRQAYLAHTGALKLDIQQQMRDPLPNGNTGEKTDKGVFCFVSQHQAGHCVYGHDVRPQEAGPLDVRFIIEVLNDDDGDQPIVNLEVYDNKNDEMIRLEEIDTKDLTRKANIISIGFSANPEQCLEFRVFWNGRCDICVRDIKLK